MATREEIVSKFKERFPDRQVSEGDIKNVEEKGLGLIDRTYEQITGQKVAQPPLATSAQQGQAGLDIPQKEDMIREERIKLTGEKPVLSQFLEKALQKKQEAFAGIDERETKLKRELTELSPLDYKGMRPSQALQRMREDAANIRSELSEASNIRSRAIDRQENFLSNIKDMYEADLAAMGLQLEDLGYQRQTEQDAVNLAFSPALLTGGVMPADLPLKYHDAWAAASQEAIRQQRASEVRSGGSRTMPDIIERSTGQRVAINPYTGEQVYEVDPSLESYVQEKLPNRSIDPAQYDILLPEYQQSIGYVNPATPDPLTVRERIEYARDSGAPYNEVVAEFPEYNELTADVYNVEQGGLENAYQEQQEDE